MSSFLKTALPLLACLQTAQASFTASTLSLTADVQSKDCAPGAYRIGFAPSVTKKAGEIVSVTVDGDAQFWIADDQKDDDLFNVKSTGIFGCKDVETTQEVSGNEKILTFFLGDGCFIPANQQVTLTVTNGVHTLSNGSASTGRVVKFNGTGETETTANTNYVVSATTNCPTAASKEADWGTYFSNQGATSDDVSPFYPAGTSGSGLGQGMQKIAVDRNGDIYAISDENTILKFTENTVVTYAGQNGVNKFATFCATGMFDADGNAAVSLATATANRKLHATEYTGNSQSYECHRLGTYFSAPRDLAFDGMGNLVVADGGTLRRINLSTGMVSLMAGASEGTTRGATALAAEQTSTGLWNSPESLAFTHTGDLIVLDSGDDDATQSCIRRISGTTITTVVDLTVNRAAVTGPPAVPAVTDLVGASARGLAVVHTAGGLAQGTILWGDSEHAAQSRVIRYLAPNDATIYDLSGAGFYDKATDSKQLQSVGTNALMGGVLNSLDIDASDRLWFTNDLTGAAYVDLSTDYDSGAGYLFKTNLGPGSSVMFNNRNGRETFDDLHFDFPVGLPTSALDLAFTADGDLVTLLSGGTVLRTVSGVSGVNTGGNCHSPFCPQ